MEPSRPVPPSGTPNTTTNTVYGAPSGQPTPVRESDNTSLYFILGGVVVAVAVLFWVFGGSDVSTTTTPAATTSEPAELAPAPADPAITPAPEAATPDPAADPAPAITPEVTDPAATPEVTDPVPTTPPASD